MKPTANAALNTQPSRIIKANRIVQNAVRMAQTGAQLQAYSRTYSRHSRS